MAVVKIVLQNGDPIHFHDVESYGIDQRSKTVSLYRVWQTVLHSGSLMKSKEMRSHILISLDAVSYLEVINDAEEKTN